LDADEPRLREEFARHPLTRALAGARLTALQGGLSNRAWRVESGGDVWFARLGHPGAARFGVDRLAECRLLQAVSAAGFAPELRVCGPSSGLLVTRFVEGSHWQASDVLQEGNLRRIGQLLASLHELPVPLGLREVSFARQASRLASSLPDGDRLADELGRRAASVFERIDGRAPVAAVCHHDLHHLNILDDGRRLWLVDWEYGGRGDPLFDIAGFLALHDADRGASALLLASYGRFSPSDAALLDQARWAFDYVQWLWFRVRFGDLPGPGRETASRLAQRLLRCNN
jgi:thiamine kinase-like enzyme